MNAACGPGMRLDSALGQGFDWGSLAQSIGGAINTYTQYKAHEDELKAQAQADIARLKATLQRPANAPTGLAAYTGGIPPSTLLVAAAAIIGIILLTRRG